MSLQPHVANPLVLTKSISLCVKAAIKTPCWPPDGHGAIGIGYTLMFRAPIPTV